MRRLLFPVLLICVILLACSFSGGTGSGSQANSLLSDPLVGLKNLDDYQATLKVSFQGTQAGQSVNITDSYVQSEWPKQAAQFTSIDTTDDSGGHQDILSGAVGDAQYFQADPNSPCTVDWGTEAGGPSDFQPASLLPTVGAAKLADEQDLGGIATQHYTFNAASLSLPAGTTANGEVWISKNGGYVVKYVLEITGADAFFGKGIQGTRQVEYSLSEVGANPEVVYPAGCEPVLADMPAMDDASDLTRLPGFLEYSTNAATADILTFYTNQLTTLGWEEGSALGPDSGLWVFTRTDTGAVALVAVDTEGSSRRVTVMAPQQGSVSASPTSAASAAATPIPNITPTPAPTADVSSLTLPKGLTVYPGATSLDTSGLTSGMAGSKYVIFHTSASPAQVIAYYHQTLVQAGWTAMPVATPSAPSDHAMGMWYMGKYTLTISASAKAGDTQVQVGWLGG